MCKGTARRAPTSSSPHEGVEPDFVPDLGLRPMARDHAGVLVQGIEPRFDGALDGLGVATPEVGPPDAPAKSVSPASSSLAASKWKHMEPGVWPGVCNATPATSPSDSSSSFLSHRSGGGAGV